MAYTGRFYYPGGSFGILTARRLCFIVFYFKADTLSFVLFFTLSCFQSPQKVFHVSPQASELIAPNVKRDRSKSNRLGYEWIQKAVPSVPNGITFYVYLVL